MIPELCPADWNHRDKSSLRFSWEGRTAEREREKKSMQAKGNWRAWDGNVP